MEKENQIKQLITQKNNEKAWELIVNEHKDLVVRFCTAIHRNDKSKGEDTAQDVFLLIERVLPKYKGESSIKNWILGIALNVYKQKNAKGTNRNRIYNENINEISHNIHNGEISLDKIMEESMEHEKFKRLNYAIKKLPETLHSIVQLRYFGGFTLKETAKTLGISLSKVKRNLICAHQILRNEVKNA